MLTAYYLALYFVLKISLSKAQYAFFKEPKTWLQAKDICSSCGGELVNWNENVSEIVSHNDIENTLVWIGNYTLQYQWLLEKGCVSTEDLKFNIIYHNNPEFCSRSCGNSQMFALKGDNCYCIDNGININHVMCSSGSDDCSSDCDTDKVKVYAFDDVYACNFEDVSCANTSYGEEKVGLSWNRTTDNAEKGIGKIGREKGHFLLLQYPTIISGNEALLAIRLNLPEIYFCLSFEYYMNYGGLLEIAVSSGKGEKYRAWKRYGNRRHMWYSSAIDVKGKNAFTVEFLGSLESNTIIGKRTKIALDNIKLKQGACNKDDVCTANIPNSETHKYIKATCLPETRQNADPYVVWIHVATSEKRMDCNFDDSLCEWDEWPSLVLRKFKSNDDYYLQNPYKTGTFSLSSSNIYPYILNNFCLRFKYLSTSIKDASLEVEVTPNSGFSIYTNYENKWITESKTFHTDEHTNVIFKWSTKNAYILLDDISIRSGLCESENLLSVDKVLNEWEVDSHLKVEIKDSQGINEYQDVRLSLTREINKYLHITSPWGDMTTDKVYTIMSPVTAIAHSTILCFLYWATSHASMAIKIKVDNNTDRYVSNKLSSNVDIIYIMDFKATRTYQIIIELTKRTNYEKSWNLGHLMVTEGICQKGPDKDTNDATMGPMCPVINIGETSRLTLAYCAQLHKRSYLCHLDESNSTDTVCKSAIFLNNSNSAFETNKSSIQTTESYIVSSESSDKQVDSERNDISTNRHPSNTSITFLEQGNRKTEMVAISISGILFAILIVLLILVLYLLIKLKRTRSSLKEKEKPNNTGPIENRSYELESIDASRMPIQTPDDTDYDIASPVNPQPQLNRNINKAHKEKAQNNRENDYQNCDNFTPDQKRDSQIYQDMEEGAYDQLGKSADRRKNFNNEADNLYDHGQPVKSQNNGIYDTTKTKTGDGYFVLEPERGSAIYDHTK